VPIAYARSTSRVRGQDGYAAPIADKVAKNAEPRE
jgi:hypothetical protein